MGISTPSRIVVLTALPVEHAAVLRHLVSPVKEHHPSGTIYERASFLSWDVLLAHVGSGNVSAALETERAIAHFDPQLAIFVGVAGGIKDVELGDVVVATKVYGYESGADRDSFEPRPDVGLSSYPLVQEAHVVARGNEWHKRIQHVQSPQVNVPRVFVAPIAAGEKVIKTAGGAVASLLRRTYGDALAVEMEGAGFLRAAYANSVDALVIRGISDLLDKKDEADASGSQEIASDHAAAFSFELLARLAGRSAADVVSIGSVAKGNNDLAWAGDSVDVWDRLRALAPRLYPRGPDERSVWEDADGDLSRLDLSGDGRTQWSRALRLLRKGGGGRISITRLIERMLDDYQHNYELTYLSERLKK